MNTALPTSSQNSQLMRKASAILEVAGVFVAGNIAASFLGPLLGVPPLNPLLDTALGEPEPNFVPLSWGMFLTLTVQYVCLMALACAIGWWHRRRNFARYGLTTSGSTIIALISIGVLGFCLVVLPFKVLWIVQQHVDLGQGSPLWALLEKPWSPSFWLFLAIGSFVFVPIVEELFFRGYCQTRLEEDFGGPGALVIVALFFVFTHGQYHQLSMLNVATIVCLLIVALGMGYIFLKTRSLVPCIMLHALLNVPTKGASDIVLPIAMVVVLALFWKRWLISVRDFVRLISEIREFTTICAVVCAVAVAVGLQKWPNVVMPIAVGGLLLALVLEYRQRRRE